MGPEVGPYVAIRWACRWWLACQPAGGRWGWHLEGGSLDYAADCLSVCATVSCSPRVSEQEITEVDGPEGADAGTLEEQRLRLFGG